MIDSAFVVLSVVGFIAYLTRGLTGAGSAIVFNALFVVLVSAGLSGGLGLLDGLYWIALADVVGAIAMAVALRDQLRFERFSLLYLAGNIPLTIVCTMLLPYVDLTALTIGLSVAVGLAGTYLAAMPRLPTLSEAVLHRLGVPAGAAAGVLNGFFGMGGPVGVLFFSHAGTDPSLFRSRFTLVALVTGLVRAAVLGLGGTFTLERLGWLAAGLPAIGLGLFVGYHAHRLVPPRPFRVGLGVIVLLAGSTALLQGLRTA